MAEWVTLTIFNYLQQKTTIKLFVLFCVLVLQSERVHNRLEMENVEQELIEKMYSQVTNEYDQQQEASRSNQQSINRITDLTSASQIYDILNTTNDPDTVEVLNNEYE